MDRVRDVPPTCLLLPEKAQIMRNIVFLPWLVFFPMATQNLKTDKWASSRNLSSLRAFLGERSYAHLRRRV